MTAPKAVSAPHQREVWALVARRVISSLEAFVILALLSFASHGRIYPSVASIATRAGCSERLVQNILKRLVKLGVLTLLARATQHRPKEYGFTPLALIAREAHRAPLDPAPGGTFATPLRGAHRAPYERNSKAAPIPSQNGGGNSSRIHRDVGGAAPDAVAPPRARLNDATSEAELVSAVAAPQKVVGIDGPALDEAVDLSAAASEPSHHTNRGRRAAGSMPQAHTPAVALASAVARPVEGKRAGVRRRKATIVDIAGSR